MPKGTDKNGMIAYFSKLVFQFYFIREMDTAIMQFYLICYFSFSFQIGKIISVATVNCST